MSALRIALYPGTFDPVTKGHLDIIGRAARLVDRLVIGVAANAGKGPLFPVAERVRMLESAIAPIGARNGTVIEVQAFDTLLIHFARRVEARLIIRGLRAVSDFEYEFQMAGMNRQLMPDVETVFLTPSDQYQFVSGTFVREIAMLGGDVSKFVAPSVLERLRHKVKSSN